MKSISRRTRQPAPLPRRSLQIERLEDRIQPAAIRSYDGSGNNLAHSTWGQAGTDLIRTSPVGYADGISTPSLPNDMSARAISNIVNSQANPANPSEDLNTVDQQSLSDFGYAFGQFMDHDMDLTLDGGAEFDIPVAANDPIGPNNLLFTRSQYDPNTGATNPRQQTTDISAYLDLSQVYGTDAATADALRTHVGGLMKTSPGNMLPYLNSTYFTPAQLAVFNSAAGGMQNDGAVASTSLFATGDVRGNENIELTALQTLFLRNHNRIAAQVQAANPTWTDEQVYQEARALNIAEYQAIVYNEWIPDTYGPAALRPYNGYNPNVNASIANEFSSVAFRFGHSLLSAGIERQTNNGTDISIVGGSDIDLATDFFDPNLLNPAGVPDPLTGLTSTDIGPILKGDADGVSQANDTMVINDVRNLLFGNGGEGGEDLIARDIQRGRDNGLPDYNTMRAAVGLPRVTSFAQITSNVQVQQELQAAYGDVNHIDAFEGGLAENHVPGSDVGPLFQAIMVDQFSRLRDGDRMFFMNQQFTPQENAIIQQGNTLSKVIEANTSITNLQTDAFVFRASINGTVFFDVNHNGQRDPNEPGLANVTVRLLDATDHSLIATTLTDLQGNYLFTPDNGIATGQFLVQEVTPTGWTQTTAAPPMQAITRGDTMIVGINFGVYLQYSPFLPIPEAPPPIPVPPNAPSAHPPATPPPATVGLPILPPPATSGTGASSRTSDADADGGPVMPSADA